MDSLQDIYAEQLELPVFAASPDVAPMDDNQGDDIAESPPDTAGAFNLIGPSHVSDINALTAVDEGDAYGLLDSGYLYNATMDTTEVHSGDIVVQHGGVWEILTSFSSFKDITQSTMDLAAVIARLSLHSSNYSNPHRVSAEQTGAYTKEATEARIAEATKDIGGKEIVDTLPDLEAADKRITYLVTTDTEGVYKQYCTNSDNTGWIYLGITQVDLSGYVTREDFGGHTGDKENPHAVTAEQVGTYTKDEIDEKFDENKKTHLDMRVSSDIVEFFTIM